MKKTAMILGWIFLILGILGFISNPLVGATGLFATSTLGNLVFLVTGIILLWVSYKAASQAGLWLKIFGIIYLIVAIVGFLSANAFLGMVSSADNWLALIVAIIMLWVGFKKSGPSMAQAM